MQQQLIAGVFLSALSVLHAGSGLHALRPGALADYIMTCYNSPTAFGLEFQSLNTALCPTKSPDFGKVCPLHRFTTFYIVSHRFTSFHIVSHRFTSFHIVSHRFISFQVVLHRFTSIRIVSHHSMLCYLLSEVKS